MDEIGVYHIFVLVRILFTPSDHHELNQINPATAVLVFLKHNTMINYPLREDDGVVLLTLIQFMFLVKLLQKPSSLKLHWVSVLFQATKP
jgi:hypothetical protein